MASKRKASNHTTDHPQVTQRIKAEPGMDIDIDTDADTGPAAPPSPLPAPIPHDPLTRQTPFYRAHFREVLPSKHGDDEEVSAKDLGTFLTLAAANAAAHTALGRESTEEYRKEFTPQGHLTVSAIYWDIGHSILTGRAAVTEGGKLELPPCYAVMRRVNVGEDMDRTRSRRVLVATAAFRDAEDLLCREIAAVVRRWKRQVREKGGRGFEVCHRLGDGKSVLSRATVVFEDLREEFDLVWAEGPVPLCIAKGAEVDDTVWSEDEA